MVFNTIIVSPVPPVAHERRFILNSLHKKFDAFGCITSIYILPRCEPSFFQYGENLAYVEFGDEKEAERALKAVMSGTIKFNCTILNGDALPSMYPFIDKLNYKCLNKIFSFLDHSSLMNVEQVCTKWKKLAKPMCNDIRELCIHPDDLSNRVKYFSRCNRYLHSFSGPINFDRDVTLLARLPYLKDLILQWPMNYIRNDRDAIHQFTLQNLKRVEIQAKLSSTDECYSPWYDLVDDHVFLSMMFDFMNYFPETVTEIHIHNSERLFYKHSFSSLLNFSKFCQLKALALCNWNLKRVTLVGLEQLKLEYLQLDDSQLNESQMNIIKNYETLKSLSLRKVPMNSDHWITLLKNNPNLEYLNIDEAPTVTKTFEGISRLQNLKCLQLRKLPTAEQGFGLKNLECLILNGEVINQQLIEFLERSCNVGVIYINSVEVLTLDDIKMITKSRDNGTTLRVYTKVNCKDADKGYDLCWPKRSKWYTRDETIPVDHSLEESCPIDKLPSRCLLKIFSYLPPQDILTLENVCRRWEKVSYSAWRNVTYLNIVEESSPTDQRRCITNCRRHLKELHCSNRRILPLVEKHCPEIEKLAIKFLEQSRRRQIEFIGGHHQDAEAYRGRHEFKTCERQLLMHLKNLTHLSLDINDHRYTYLYFLQYLPTAMVELHLLQGSSTQLVDLTKLVNLQALSLIDFHFDGNSLVGMENLKKLTSLTIDGCSFTGSGNNSMRQLKSLNNLTYLSMKEVHLDDETLWLILRRNLRLKVLRLHTILSSQLCRMHLEYFELEWMSDSRIIKVIDQLPQLKLLYLHNYPQQHDRYAFDDSIAIKRDVSVKICFEKDTAAAASKLNELLPNVVLVKTLTEEEMKIFANNYWIIKNEHTTNSFVKPLRTDYSPVLQLTEDCLAHIFSYLPMRTRYDAAQVCKRWRSVFKNLCLRLCKSFDIREFSMHENLGKYIAHHGRRMEDIYYYYGCGMSRIEKNCPKVKSLAIDFRFRCCRCLSYEEQKHRFNVQDLSASLAKFRYLTCLMLKGADFIISNDVLRNLPKCLQEIHIFISASKRLRNRPNVIITQDLSRYKDLRALTFVCWNEITEIKLFGLGTLKKLIYLRVEGPVAVDKSGESFSRISKLEYLSLSKTRMSEEDVTILVKNNSCLQYLNITNNWQSLSNQLFEAISDLKKLSYFRIAIGNVSGTLHPNLTLKPGSFNNLELLDCQLTSTALQSVIYDLIIGALNLKILNLSVQDEVIIERVINAAANNILNRGSSSGLKIYLGRHGFKMSTNFETCLSHVLLDDIPPNDYDMLFEKNYWGGWCTRSGRTRISEILIDMKDRLSHH